MKIFNTASTHIVWKEPSRVPILLKTLAGMRFLAGLACLGPKKLVYRSLAVLACLVYRSLVGLACLGP